MITTKTRQSTTIHMNAADVAFGKTCGYHLQMVGIPDHLCEVAAATCMIDIMGWRKGCHNGEAPRNETRHFLSGRWVHTKMATYGKTPIGPSNHNWRGGKSHRARFIQADNFGAADYILGCFDGITVEEVIEWATSGDGLTDDDRITVSLREVVEGLRPALVLMDSILTSADNADNVKHEFAMVH